MSSTNFKTENNTFRKLIGNGLSYRIPRFQRDYSWADEQWEDLWLDIENTLRAHGSSSHYMGYLVLHSTDDKHFDVIDGQQRLTTISLIVLAILKNLKRLVDAGSEADSNSRRIDQIRQTYIGYLDPVTLLAKPKMTLNRNNNNYFQTYLVPLGHLPERGFRASEHGLRKAFTWFDRRVAERLKEKTGEEGMRLAKLVETLSDRLFFTIITVTDELNAYSVFETLNARGVRLSATDLLKNYLFSVLDCGDETEHQLRSLETRWEAIVDRLQAEKFPDFLRAHWNSRQNFARQADLFKVIRAHVTEPKAVFKLLREMEEDLDTYLGLSSPEPAPWPTTDKQLAGTLKTFRVRQPFPLLLAAKRAFDASDFTDLLRATVAISMRFNVIGSHSSGEQERKYNEVAQRVAKGELMQIVPSLQALRAIYIDDRAFRAAFAEKSIRTTDSRNNHVVRLILGALEKHLSGQDVDTASESLTIEHILAQNAPDGREGIGHDDAEALIYRLGNMTLLQAGANRQMGNVAYARKREAYQNSAFALTRKVAAEHGSWTPDRIAAHQRWMAAQATAIWRIAQLG